MRSLSHSAGIILLACLTLSGCATTPLDEARHQFQQGQAQAAIATLEDPDNHSSRNSLLFYMNKGLIFHHLGEYKKSSREFRKATELMESQDYISLSEQTATLLINDWMADYKGEYSERLWVHTYQMMNYLLLGQYESTAVEARQAIKVLEKYPQPLKQDWFTQALIGLSFESVGKINDAYIVYKKLALQLPDSAPIALQLYRLAKQLGFSADATKYQDSIPGKLQNLSPDNSGELILFLANGAIPKKVSGDIFAPPDIRISFPHYQDSSTPPPTLRVQDAKHELPFTAISTHLGDVASASLHARGTAMIAKHAARLGTKQAIVHNLKKNDESAAELVNLLFFLFENADTRGWGTLPANLVMLRIPLAPGTHNLRITSNQYRHSLKEPLSFDGLSIKSQQRIFRKMRN